MENTKWYHCTTHTYGAWLYGDPRGFRTRHHREHIEGDYKNPPPPGMYDAKLKRSQRLMTQPPVIIPNELRAVVGQFMVVKFLEVGAQLLCLSGQHVHLLAKMPMGEIPRKWIGMAKRNATFALKERNWQGELWAVRSGIHPINDREHQVNTYHYILRHADRGAWVWDFRFPNQSCV